MIRWEKRDLTLFSRRWRVSTREVRPTTATPREERVVEERVGRMDWTTSTASGRGGGKEEVRVERSQFVMRERVEGDEGASENTGREEREELTKTVEQHLSSSSPKSSEEVELLENDDDSFLGRSGEDSEEMGWEGGDLEDFLGLKRVVVGKEPRRETKVSIDASCRRRESNRTDLSSFSFTINNVFSSTILLIEPLRSHLPSNLSDSSSIVRLNER